MSPKVSVVMPLYNGEKHLRSAVQSILEQTFTDFEFLVVDDGSTDRSLDILAEFKDDRIKVLGDGGHRGIAQTLNLGLATAAGDYIARMDSDDVSLPTRLHEQTAFLDRHPSVGICGSWTKTLGARLDTVLTYEPRHEDIVANLLFSSAISHPTAMMRTDLLRRHGLKYSDKFEHAEDYELWVKASRHFELANIPRVLVRYRVHPASVSHLHPAAQDKGTCRLRLEQLNWMKRKMNGEAFAQASGALEAALCFELRDPVTPSERRALLDDIEQGLEAILAINSITGHYDHSALRKAAYKRWLKACSREAELGLWTWRRFHKSGLSAVDRDARSLQHLAKFLLQCLLRKRVYRW